MGRAPISDRSAASLTSVGSVVDKGYALVELSG